MNRLTNRATRPGGHARLRHARPRRIHAAKDGASILQIAILGALGACNGDRAPLGPEAASDVVAAVAEVRFVENDAQPFGTFGGVEYVRHTGRFVGRTGLGEFRVPYEIVAPVGSKAGNGTVLIEPPHFAFGLSGRGGVLGRDLLFDRGFSYASVGFGTNGLNILDPAATDAVIAGQPVANPGVPDLTGVADEEILVLFSEALVTEAFAIEVLGEIRRRYAFGVSQTAAALLETLHSPGGRDLFDFTLLYLAQWRPPFQAPHVFDRLNGEFAPLPDVGHVIFVASEGDQLLSDSEQFRRAAPVPGYRVYEVSGTAHLPAAPPLNPLDHSPVARAMFIAGDAWVRTGHEPPPSRLMESAPEGAIDPVYGFPTGIARDGDLNALGGVRLPDLHVGRALFIAAEFAIAPLPGLNGLLGIMVDLACEPLSPDGGPRFRNHGEYVSGVTRQANRLRRDEFLLPDDAELLKEEAAGSEVGKPGTCPG